jgi:hypothetical protein
MASRIVRVPHIRRTMRRRTPAGQVN